MSKITWEQLYATISTETTKQMDWRTFFDERQLKEIGFDTIYADGFAHGTDGHNARLIIAKMAELLDLLQSNITFHGEVK